MIKWSLHGSTPIVKRFSDKNFLSPVKSGPKMAVFRELRGVHDKFLFSNPEKGLEDENSVARYRIVWHIMRENRFRGLGCRPLEEPGKKEAE